jgi:hypothetical protein
MSDVKSIVLAVKLIVKKLRSIYMSDVKQCNWSNNISATGATTSVQLFDYIRLAAFSYWRFFEV